MLLRFLAGVVVLSLAGLTGLLLYGVGSAREGLRVVGREAGPQVVAANDLHGALAAMDAELANVVLVGDERGMGFDRDQALANFDRGREAVARALQKSAAHASGASARASVADLIEQLGVYDNLAGQVTLADRQADARSLTQPSPALEQLRRATDVMHGRLLPAADLLVANDSRAIEEAFGSRYGGTRTTAGCALALGLLTIAVLVGTQVFVALRTRRILNPGLAAATVLAAILTVWSTSTLFAAAEHLRVAKRDSFDSVLALTRTKAVAADANGDESRYLVDPQRVRVYQEAFFAKSQQLAGVPGGRMDTYDDALERAARNPANLEGALFGREFRNITFPGEHEAAEVAFRWYRTYQMYDRRMRVMFRTDPRGAIDFDTSYRDGNSNWAFDHLQRALDEVLRINRAHMDAATRDGESALSGWTIIPALATTSVAALTVLGMRPRLREYRARA